MYVVDNYLGHFQDLRASYIFQFEELFWAPYFRRTRRYGRS